MLGGAHDLIRRWDPPAGLRRRRWPVRHHDEGQRVYGVFLDDGCEDPVIVGVRTPLALIHELWADHQHACPYVRHDARGCFCASPTLPEDGDRYMPCDVYSIQLWCLTKADYTRCHFYPAGDMP